MSCRSTLCEKVSKLLQVRHTTVPEKKRMLGKEFVGKRRIDWEGGNNNKTVVNNWRRFLGNRGKRGQDTEHKADMRQMRHTQNNCNK